MARNFFKPLPFDISDIATDSSQYLKTNPARLPDMTDIVKGGVALTRTASASWPKTPTRVKPLVSEQDFFIKLAEELANDRREYEKARRAGLAQRQKMARASVKKLVATETKKLEQPVPMSKAHRESPRVKIKPKPRPARIPQTTTSADGTQLLSEYLALNRFAQRPSATTPVKGIIIHRCE